MKLFWIIPNKLAVVEVPLDEDDIKELVNNGIKALVSLFNIADLSLTWNSLDELHNKIREYSIEVLSLPTLSKKAPKPEKALELVKWIDKKIREGKIVAIGCRRGWGRGGSIVAAYLVYKGHDPVEANEFVERMARYYNVSAMDSEEQRSLAFKIKQLLSN